MPYCSSLSYHHYNLFLLKRTWLSPITANFLIILLKFIKSEHKMIIFWLFIEFKQKDLKFSQTLSQFISNMESLTQVILLLLIEKVWIKYIWLFLFKEMSPAFIIANQGYDVWLGNSRGNKYSRTHVTKSADSIDFWDFSW